MFQGNIFCFVFIEFYSIFSCLRLKFQDRDSQDRALCIKQNSEILFMNTDFIGHLLLLAAFENSDALF